MRYIAIDRRGSYMWVTFNRPDKLNVLHAEDLPGLRDTIVNLDPGMVHDEGRWCRRPPTRRSVRSRRPRRPERSGDDSAGSALIGAQRQRP